MKGDLCCVPRPSADTADTEARCNVQSTTMKSSMRVHYLTATNEGQCVCYIYRNDFQSDN